MEGRFCARDRQDDYNERVAIMMIEANCPWAAAVRRAYKQFIE